MIIELSDPFHVTAGVVGEPGDRTFYVQCEDRDHRVTVTAEKQQVDGLAKVLVDLLARLDDEPATDWDREAMALRDPVEPAWRVGAIGAGIDEERSRFLLELVELAPDDEDRDVVRLWLDRDQARRLAAHAIEVVAAGRPACRFCGRPEEADGHVCPATNGHGALSR